MMSDIVTAVVQLSQPGFCFAVSSSSLSELMFMLAGTPTVVIVLNSVLAGVIAAVAVLRGGAAVSVTLGAGVLAFAVAVVLHALYARRNITKTKFAPLFPTPVAKP